MAAHLTMESTVPWQFSESGSYTQWIWVTRDFTATVACSGSAWSWEVKSAAAVPIGAGAGHSFDTCAELALEAIGKGFAESAGYARWTRAASRRYELAAGVRVDLADGEGKAVRVTLTSGQTIDGVLHLGDWTLHLVEGGKQREVHPGLVSRVDRLA